MQSLSCPAALYAWEEEEAKGRRGEALGSHKLSIPAHSESSCDLELIRPGLVAFGGEGGGLTANTLAPCLPYSFSWLQKRLFFFFFLKCSKVSQESEIPARDQDSKKARTRKFKASGQHIEACLKETEQKP